LNIIGPLSGEGINDSPKSEYVKRLERAVRRSRLVNRVHFKGAQVQAAKYGLLSGTDVFVSPSTAPEETFHISNLEALACAVPVVATRVGGVPEVVIQGKTGILVEAGDHEGLARGIIAALRDPAKARQMVLAGKELVRNSHSVGHMLDQLEGVYARGKRQR